MSEVQDFENGMWAIVELMGHVRVGGYVTEEERFGTKMGRIDIYTPDGRCVTQYFGGQSVYRLTPTTEEIARAIARHAPAPVSVWELRQLDAPEPDDDEEEDWHNDA